MKYIVFADEDTGNEFIVTFPKMFDHDRFAEVVDMVRVGDSRNWERLAFVDNYMPVAAGFVYPSGECYGRSETLNLDSRGAQDTALLKNGNGFIKGPVASTP